VREENAILGWFAGTFVCFFLSGTTDRTGANTQMPIDMRSNRRLAGTVAVFRELSWPTHGTSRDNREWDD
jgi:hypothetical protein